MAAHNHSEAAWGPPLWRQMQAVAAVIAQVRAGRSATVAIAAVDAALRPGVQALAFQVLRSLGAAQVLRSRLVTRNPPPLADALLCSALALGSGSLQAQPGDPSARPYDLHTLVDQTVEAAKRSQTMRAQAGFINACLRRFLREGQAMLEAAAQEPLARWNHPAWWIDQTRRDWPEHWQAILTANNVHPPLTLRVNQRRIMVDDFLAALHSKGLVARPVGNNGVELSVALPVQKIPGFDQGWFSVQDAAAQLAAELLLGDVAPGKGLSQPANLTNTGAKLRVLDACAAPGGKTAHLLELADCAVTAIDIDIERCQRIAQTLARLGLQADIKAADAAKPATWWDGQPFDAILLDAPCTASGIVRRHPDVRWLRRESDIAQLARLQADLLAALWPLLRVGGRLLYCTCSVFKAEGQQQVQTFLAHNTDARSKPSPGHLMPQSGASGGPVRDNLKSDHDGFFFALFEKLPALP